MKRAADLGCGDVAAKPRMKGLIVDEPWISLIISGKKTWEMRSRNTLVRGSIALIRKGSKTVIGIADLVRTVRPAKNGLPRPSTTGRK